MHPIRVALRLTAWLALAGLLVPLCMAAAERQLRIDWPPGAKQQRKGKLTLSVQLPASSSIPNKGKAKLEVSEGSVPESQLAVGETGYTRVGDLLQTEVDFCRPLTDAPKFMLTLKVLDGVGMESSFVSKSDNIAALARQPDESAESASCSPRSPQEPLKLRSRPEVKKVAVGRPQYRVTLVDLAANRAGTVIIKIDDPTSRKELYSEVRPVGTVAQSVIFETSLTSSSQLHIIDKASSSELLGPYPLPIDWPWYWPEGQLARIWLFLFWFIVVAVVLLLLIASIQSVVNFWWRKRFPATPADGPAAASSKGGVPAGSIALTGEPEAHVADEAKQQQQGPSTVAPAPHTRRELATPRGEDVFELLQTAIHSLTQNNEHLKQQMEKAQGALREAEQTIARLLHEKPPMPKRPPLQPAQYEIAMLATLNRWWREETLDRDKLRKFVADIGLPAHFCTLREIERVMQSMNWTGPYLFELSEKDGGWLWCDLPDSNESIVLPADPVFFQTTTAVQAIQRIIVGLNNVNPKPRFVKAFKACHLVAIPEKPGRYRATKMGEVAVKGLPMPSSTGEPIPEYESLLHMTAAAPVPAATEITGTPPLWFTETAQKFVDAFASVVERMSPVRPHAVRTELAKRPGSVIQPPGVGVAGPGVAEWVKKELAGIVREVVRAELSSRPAVEAPLVVATSSNSAPVANRPSEVLAELVRRAVQQEFSKLPPTPDLQHLADGVSREIGKTLPAMVHRAVREGLAPEGPPAPPPAAETVPLARERPLAPSPAAETVPLAREIPPAPLPAAETVPLAREIPPAPLPAAETVPLARETPPAPLPAAETVRGSPLDPWWTPELLKQAYPENPKDVTYPERLVALREALVDLWLHACVQITHLSKQGSGFALHAAQVKMEGASPAIICEVCGGNPGEYQFFVTVDLEKATAVSVLLPPGKLAKYNFPAAYEVLLDPSPQGAFEIVSLRCPAVLRKGLESIYTVEKKMECISR